MSKLLNTISLVFISYFVVAQTPSLERLQVQVDSLLQQKKIAEQGKRLQIDSIRSSLQLLRRTFNTNEIFSLQQKLTKAYLFFIQDSAYYYAQQASRTAYGSEQQELIQASKLNVAWVFLLKGFFKEAADTLQSINRQILPVSYQNSYRTAMYRMYYDLSISRQEKLVKQYISQGDKYCEEIWEHNSPMSYEYLLSKALHHLAHHNTQKSMVAYTTMLDSLSLSHHQKAVCHYGLGIQLGYKMGKMQEMKRHLLLSTLHDLYSCTKETAASRSLAEQFFAENDIVNAYKFILNAKEDADFYDSHLRKLEVAKLLPKVEIARFRKMEEEKTRAKLTSIAIGGFSLVVLYLSVIFYRQIKKVNSARKEILLKNKHLAHRNEQLREANKIKEEYIAYYFNFSTQYIDKLEAIKRSVLQRVIAKRFEDVDRELRKFDPKVERAALFEHFDQIFLSLFPTFVQQFNALFGEKDQIKLKNPQCLTTDLRIFALLRLGITNNEKIASLLKLSVNTIYTYKTKVKKRSFVPNDEFESKIQEISFQ